jgi:hypothetical protein
MFTPVLEMSFQYFLGCLVGIAALTTVSCGNDSVGPTNGGPTNGTGASDGSGGAALGGSGGTGPVQVFLGRACETDVDCGELLRCLNASSVGDGDAVPAGGYCTIPCATQAGCVGFAPDASCRELAGGRTYCVLDCDFGPAALGDKCHGRLDVACAAIDDESSPACVPRCSDDSQCCADSAPCDSYCDPASGLCSSNVPDGLPIGTPCAGPGDPDCRGICDAVAGDAQTHVCTELCTFGAFPACGWRPSEGPATAYCHLTTEDVDVERAAGDAGLCAQLCDCDDDCDSTLNCEPFVDERDALATQRAGVCTATVSPSIPCAAGGAGGGGGELPSLGGARASAAGSGHGGVAAGGESVPGGGVGGVPAGVAGSGAIVQIGGAGGAGGVPRGHVSAGGDRVEGAAGRGDGGQAGG